MNIVILDGYVANSGDLSWQDIAKLGELTIYDRTAPGQIVERARGAEALFTNKVLVTDEVLAALPELKFIGVLATGVNNIDIAAASRRGITVCNVPAYSTASVVQTIFALLLEITNRVHEHSEACRAGAWAECQDFSFRISNVVELAGRTFGIYGLGNIGLAVARVADALGMKVIALTSKSAGQLPAYITPVGRDELFGCSDVLALCAPLTDDNRHFVNADTLSLMKSSAILINTARGGLVDSVALAHALNEGRIAAAGVDVLDTEPPTPDEPLLSARNCVITPHYAWASREARQRLIRISAANLEAYIHGNPQNVVNP